MPALKKYLYNTWLPLLFINTLGFSQPIRFVYLHADSEQKQTFQSILKVSDTLWQKASTPNFGKKGGTGWAKFNMFSNRSQLMWLEAQSHFIDSLSLMMVENSTNAHLRKICLINSQEKLVNHRYFLFPLHLRAGIHYTIYLKGYVPAPDVLKFPLVLWQPTDFLNFNQKDHWGWAIFVGFMLMAIAISIINYIFHPSLIYLFYAGYVGCIAVYALLNDGWGIYLPKPLLFLDHNIILGHWLNAGLGCFLLFSRKFLNIRPSDEKWWLRVNPLWLTLLMEIAIGFIHLGQWLHHSLLFKFSYQAGSVISLFYLVWWVLYVRDAFQRNFKPVWLHIAGVGVSIAFYFTNIVLNSTGLIKEPLPEMMIFRWVIIIDVLLILIGWVYRQLLYQKMQKQLEFEVQRQKEAVYEANVRQQAEEIKSLRFQNELQHQRERLARDLHDGIGSQLTHIINRLDILAFRAEQPQSLITLSEFTRETNQNLRETLWILNQESILAQQWYERTLSWLGKFWDDREVPLLNTDFISLIPYSLSPVTAIALFRITQEAVNNSLKYADAQTITFSLRITELHLSLCIADDGHGFDLQKVIKGYGLTNMKHRAEEIGGIFRLNADKNGTMVQVELPAF